MEISSSVRRKVLRPGRPPRCTTRSSNVLIILFILDFFMALVTSVGWTSSSPSSSSLATSKRSVTTADSSTTLATTFSSGSSKLLLDRNIFVFNFPPVPHVYSICPFAIKLESFLRINKIPYENIYGQTFSSKFMMPFIRLDHPDKDIGEEIPDSNIIINRINKELSNNSSASYYSESTLTPQQRSITHSIIRMLEEHTQQIGFYYRYGLNMEDFISALDIEHRFRPGASKIWLNYQPNHTKNKTKFRGLTRHIDEEIWHFSYDDIQAISDCLGDNIYMLGGTKPTLLDCAVFGHLSQFLWIPINFPQKEYIINNCPNIVRFMNHFRSTYWSDWDDLCSITIDYTNNQTSIGNKPNVNLFT